MSALGPHLVMLFKSQLSCCLLLFQSSPGLPKLPGRPTDVRGPFVAGCFRTKSVNYVPSSRSLGRQNLNFLGTALIPLGWKSTSMQFALLDGPVASFFRFVVFFVKFVTLRIRHGTYPFVSGSKFHENWIIRCVRSSYGDPV